MTGKHYRWQRRWVVDLAARTAIHDSGLIVAFSESRDGAIDGEAVNGDAWIADKWHSMPARDLERHAARLMREAGDVYQRALTRAR